jgi:aryl carrier-like protein
LNKDNTTLICWVVLKTRSSSDTTMLGKYLEERLPPPMRPSRFNVVDGMPMTRSGKIDRALLQKWTWDEHRANVIGIEQAVNLVKNQRTTTVSESMPTSPIERMMSLWQEVIGQDGLNQDRSFFDTGGDSITAIRLIARIRRSYGVQLGIRDLFEHPTPAALLDFVEKSLSDNQPSRGASSRRAQGG